MKVCKKSKFLALILSLAVIFSSLPFTAATASAEENAEADGQTNSTPTVMSVNLKQSDNSIAGIENPIMTGDKVASTDSMTYVNFGTIGASTPVAYRVLDKKTTDFTGEATPTMLLDCDKVLNAAQYSKYSKGYKWQSGGIKYFDNNNRYVDWSKPGSANQSNIPKILASRTEWSSKLGNYTLSNGAYNAIAKSSKAKASDIPSDVVKAWDVRLQNDNSLNEEQLFCLSYAEVKKYYGYSPSDSIDSFEYLGKTATIGSTTPYWWLRSVFANYYDGCAGDVDNVGVRLDTVSIRFGVSPALNLNLASVIFTSKKSEIESFGMVEAQDDAGTKSNPWTLGLKTIDTTPTVIGEPVVADRKISFSLASTPTNTQKVGAAVCDSSGAVLGFGEATATDATNKNYSVDEICGKGNTLKVFFYEENSNDATIHCSDMASVNLPDIVHGNWSYTATGSTLKASCTDCIRSASLTINIKDEFGYSSTKRTPATYGSGEEENWRSTGLYIPKITYQKLTSGEYVDIGENPPIEMGKYKALATMGGATAEKAYEITQYAQVVGTNGDTITPVVAPIKSGMIEPTSMKIIELNDKATNTNANGFVNSGNVKTALLKFEKGFKYDNGELYDI